MQDRAGELQRVTDIFSDLGTNIYSISHNRLKDGIRPGFVSVGMILETKDKLHAKTVIRTLVERGVEVDLQ